MLRRDSFFDIMKQNEARGHIMARCFWCNEKNPIYVKYHDEEWGNARFDDGYLFEMLLLESFQAGLSWECVLNKRENFRIAFDGFDARKIWPAHAV